jgi:hypothetical protein
MDYHKVMYGENAIHVPAWMAVQDAGEGLVSFIGASRVPEPHPLRYGSDKTHQLIVGELVIRPHYVTHSDARRGSGLDALLLDPFTGLADGELLVGRRACKD